MMSKLRPATEGLILAFGFIAFGWVMLSLSAAILYGAAVGFAMMGIPSILLGFLGYYIESKQS